MTDRELNQRREIQYVDVQRHKAQRTRQTEMSRRAPRGKRRRKRKVRRSAFTFLFMASLMLCLLLLSWELDTPRTSPPLPEGIPDELTLLLECNSETYDFVTEYPNRESYLSRPVDLSSDKDVTNALAEGKVPRLMQWDLRWGYAPYGDDMVGLAGCGPTCLSMVYLYLTNDTSMDPAAMAKFAYAHGYYTKSGTEWALWTDGVSFLGLSGDTLSLDESVMMQALDDGKLIVCSMRPGDFTTTGHFILIHGYDENGFYINDPNRKSNCDKQWSYSDLFPQIKNLWAVAKL